MVAFLTNLKTFDIVTTYLIFLRKNTQYVYHHICQVNPLPSGRYGLRGVSFANLFHVTGHDQDDHLDDPDYPDC